MTYPLGVRIFVLGIDVTVDIFYKVLEAVFDGSIRDGHPAGGLDEMRVDSDEAREDSGAPGRKC